MTNDKTDRDPREILAAIDRIDDDPLDPSYPIEEVDEELRAAGLSPEAIGARGAALAARLLAQGRAAFRDDTKAGATPLTERVNGAQARPKATRARMLERVREAEADPRFAGQIAVAARGRRPDEPTDEELAALCATLEALGILKPEA